MKSFLSHRAKRWGYDGWALRHKDVGNGRCTPLWWTVCTTREEVRELQRTRKDFFSDFEIVKVKIKVEEVV